MVNFPVLSVIVLAYNQEKYILQTLHGVLAQRVTFNYRILVTEDGSSDHTRAIIQSVINDYPDMIIPFFNDENLGLNETLKRVIPSLDTKYACFLGGDDYWVDEYKLQKQYDLLERNQQLSFIHTGFQFLIEPENILGEIIDSWNWDMPEDRNARLVSFLSHRFSLYPCASTSCFRVKPFLDCYAQHPQLLDYGVGEGTLLHTSMCMFGGDYMFLPDVTTIYRRRSESLSHFKDIRDQILFQLKYLKLKIVVFRMFGVPNSLCHSVINADLERNYTMAYSSDILNDFKNSIIDIGLDDNTLQMYEAILSSSIKRTLYYWYVRIKNRIKRFCWYDKCK